MERYTATKKKADYIFTVVTNIVCVFVCNIYSEQIEYVVRLNSMLSTMTSCKGDICKSGQAGATHKHM